MLSLAGVGVGHRNLRNRFPCVRYKHLRPAAFVTTEFPHPYQLCCLSGAVPRLFISLISSACTYQQGTSDLPVTVSSAAAPPTQHPVYLSAPHHPRSSAASNFDQGGGLNQFQNDTLYVFHHISFSQTYVALHQVTSQEKRHILHGHGKFYKRIRRAAFDRFN